MPSLPDLRIITKAARLYYEERLTQTEIAGKLGISQVAVSRLLKRAEEYGIVRTTVISRRPSAKPAGSNIGWSMNVAGRMMVQRSKPALRTRSQVASLFSQ